MVGQRTQHMIEKLAHQDNFFPGTHCSQQLLHGFTAQLWFQHILEVFFAEQIQAILADAAQQRVQKPCGKGAAGRIGTKWPAHDDSC